jgi:hypothetical protein
LASGVKVSLGLQQIRQAVEAPDDVGVALAEGRAAELQRPLEQGPGGLEVPLVLEQVP